MITMITSMVFQQTAKVSYCECNKFQTLYIVRIITIQVQANILIQKEEGGFEWSTGSLIFVKYLICREPRFRGASSRVHLHKQLPVAEPTGAQHRAGQTPDVLQEYTQVHQPTDILYLTCTTLELYLHLIQEDLATCQNQILSNRTFTHERKKTKDLYMDHDECVWSRFIVVSCKNNIR